MDFDEEFKESQKVSELASHLLRTGTAASSAEAEKRAREMIYGTVAATPKPVAQETKANSDEYIKMLEMSHNLIMKELSAIKYKHDQLLSEIMSLKTDLSKMQIQAAARPERAPVAETKAEEKSAETKSEPVSRSGVGPGAQGFKAEDVSVDKYFYFGQKK